MDTQYLVKIIIKAIGIYLLYIIGVGFLGLLNPMLLNQPFSLATTQLISLIIPVIFAYTFLIKSEEVANWLVPSKNNKLEISQPQLIYILIVLFGLLAVTLGFNNCLSVQYSSMGNPEQSSGYSYGFSLQIGNIFLVIVGFMLLKNREKFAQKFTKKIDYTDEGDNILK